MAREILADGGHHSRDFHRRIAVHRNNAHDLTLLSHHHNRLIVAEAPDIHADNRLRESANRVLPADRHLDPVNRDERVRLLLRRKSPDFNAHEIGIPPVLVNPLLGLFVSDKPRHNDFTRCHVRSMKSVDSDLVDSRLSPCDGVEHEAGGNTGIAEK